MDSALSIADSSLNAQTAALAVTAENVANSQTAGYVAEEVDFQATAGDTSGVGMGVQVTSIAQANDALLTTNNLQAQASLSSVSSASEVLTAIQNVFPLGQDSSSDSTDSDNTSLTGQLANFWSAWDTIAEDPSAVAGTSQVVDDAQGLVTTLNEASTQLSNISQNTSASLSDQVSQVNTLLQQAAELNNDIVSTDGSGGNPAQLQDQMNQTVQQLAQIAGVTAQQQSDGTTTISIGGVTLVQETSAQSLGVQTSDGTTSITTDNGQISVPVSSGTISGLLSGINQYIPEYESQINDVANTLETMVNNQLSAGYTLSGESGSDYPLFVGSDAGGIAVNTALSADPSLLAVSSTTGAAGANDGSNAQTIAEFANSTSGPDTAYQTLIQNIGTANQTMNQQVTSQTATATQASTAWSAASGVNENTELTNMMSYQQTYEASAKLLTTVESTLESLMDAI